MPKPLANALLFQLGWLICVFAGDSLWLLAVAPIVAIHLRWIGSWAAEGKLLISVFLAGCALPSVLKLREVLNRRIDLNLHHMET